MNPPETKPSISTLGLFTRERITFQKLFRNEILTLSWFEAWIYPLWTQSPFKLGFWNAEKRVFWIVIHLKSLILRTCEHNTLSERELCMRIWEYMHAGAIHGSICAVGTKYYLAVCRTCSWLKVKRRLQCLWMHRVQTTNPIRKRIAIQNGFQNVISSFVNRPNVSLRSPWGKLRLPNHLAAIGYAWMSLIHH